MTVDDFKFRIISALDWFDDRILRHCLHRFGLCTWIADHSWWGPDHWQAQEEMDRDDSQT